MARPRSRPRRPQDERRRSHSQNLLVDRRVVAALIERLDLVDDELVVEIGPGRGALTVPLARSGVRVLAVERDLRLLGELDAALRRAGLAERVRLLHLDGRRLRWPREPYRVVANLPFGATTALLAHMLDDPERRRVAPTSSCSARWR